MTLLLRPRPTAAEQPQVAPEAIGAQRPQERRYLSRQAWTAANRADPSDIQEVRRFARRFGLQVTGQNRGARTVYLSGPAANMARAFRVSLRLFRHGRRIYRGRTGPVRVPLILDGVVVGVFGLDNRRVAKPHFRLGRRLGGAWPHAGNISYLPSEVAQLYDFPTGVDGTGETIGIIELGGGYRLRDLRRWFRRQGLRLPNVVAVSVNGGQNQPTGNPGGPDGEVMLDIEVAGGVAPGASIVVYFAPNTTQGFLRAITRAVHDNVHQPTVLSISWGGPEASWSQQSLNAFNQAFQAAAAMGVTVLAAAGDGGSSDGVAGRLAHADFPASSPYVIACGGTRLDGSGATISSEVVWNDGPQGGAGGGGVSDGFALPSWQAGAGVPPSVNPGNFVGRGLPDLAGNADENTGYKVRVDGIDTVIGGTSAVAPLVSGLIALANQSLGTPVGYVNPLLYSSVGSSGAFRDITTGNNDMTGLVGGYSARVGWDACTGFGTPRGNALIAALQSSSPAGSSGPANSNSMRLSSSSSRRATPSVPPPPELTSDET